MKIKTMLKTTITISVFMGINSMVSADSLNDCVLKENTNPQLNMWWQGSNDGSPKHEGRVKFDYKGGSDAKNLLFQGRFWADGSAYNIAEAKINGTSFSFKTTTFDRPGRTGRETYLTGTGTCGILGILGTFTYVDKNPDATIYTFGYGMTPIPSVPEVQATR